MIPTVVKLNLGTEEEMSITGYCRSRTRFCLTLISVILSGGLLLMLLSWKKSVRLKASHCPCALNKAEKVLLVAIDGQEFVEKVNELNIEYFEKRRRKTYFVNRKVKYVWSARLQNFVKVCGLNHQKTFSSFHSSSSGLTTPVAAARIQFYGLNSIAVDVKSIFYLLKNEAVNPFYIFQLFTITVWFVQQYYYFTVGILLLSAISIICSVWETRKQSQTLKKAVLSKSMVIVVRDDKEIVLSSNDLVPGDVIVLSTANIVLECDALLISGQCIINESALTGESIPVTKTAIPEDSEEMLQITEHKRHLLFSGTELLQARCLGGGKVKAVVIRTGFSTLKGELVRSILFPKPLEFKFYTDFIKFFAIFILLGIVAVIYSAIVWTLNKATVLEIVIFTLDIFTFVVPPILPAAYTSITAISQRRLKKHGIYCLSSKYINMCAGVNVMCFDKTGTLTEEGLNLLGVVPVQKSRVDALVQDPTHLSLNSPFLHAIATCHNLTWIDDHISGYPLDIVVFGTINWVLEEIDALPDLIEDLCTPVVVYPANVSKAAESSKLVVLKQFPFESALQRMSVIARAVNSSQYNVYVKGAPERILTLCSPDSIPADFEIVLAQYTQKGYRVIAVAWKPLPELWDWSMIKAKSRNEIECDLEFLGLIILQNFLKPETTRAIQQLKAANIRNVMVTGDNLSTAISIARECDMLVDNDKVITVNAKLTCGSENPNEERLEIVFRRIQLSPTKNEIFILENMEDECKVNFMSEEEYHFAMDGPSFFLLRKYYRQLLLKIIHQGTVFARMLPEQKIHLVNALQELGHQVGMCGDGANDCGALKTAHAGVSLSVAEASVAAPFTSKKTNISCVIPLICEGRASLVSCMGIFKYQVAYCFSLLLMCLILLYKGIRPSDPQFVYMDVFLSVVPAITFGNCEAYSRLASHQPTKKLLDTVSLTSIFSFLLIQVSLYLTAWEYCSQQPWYEEFKYVPGVFELPPSYEATAMFSVCLFSILAAVVVFSEGPPFRKSLYTNKILTAFLIISFGFSSYLVIWPSKWVIDLLVLKVAPVQRYLLFLYGITIAHCILSYVWEVCVVRYFVAQKIVPAARKRYGSKPLHERLQFEADSDPAWPPVDQKQVFAVTITQITASPVVGKPRDKRRQFTRDSIDLGFCNRRTFTDCPHTFSNHSDISRMPFFYPLCCNRDEPITPSSSNIVLPIEGEEKLTSEVVLD